MFNVKTVAAILAVGLFVINTCFSKTATVEDNWNDYLHYTKIGRLDVAAGYAQAVLDGNPDPVQLLTLSEKTQQGYAILLKVVESGPDAKLAELSKKILAIIEQGRFIRRTDPKIIVEEIKRLTGTERGRMTAVKRLQNAGEYSIMYMLEALADESRKDEAANIIWALPQVGRDSLRPLAAALQSKNVPIKAEIIKAMGKIGYPQ
ncbi:MAG: HEAT repeat domain-containing protein, partial [Planctomycetota bacterium]|nr:HEAT repeat domain-containing protein [Planctomycetota bacterium]